MRRMRLLAAGVMMLLAQPCASALAAVEPRLALVIGNGGYDDSLGPLRNAVNDMRLMADALRGVGFEVIERAEADKTTMQRAIQEFGRRLEEAGRDAVGLFYFAGHGVQISGNNYMIPLAASIARQPDVESEAVELDWVLAQMEYARNRMNILILDACRNNPLPRSFRSSEQGLSRIDAPRGTLIAYATAPGTVSSDGEGSNSPYTQALAAAMMEPGLEVETVFRKVRVQVMAATGDRQVPWESSSLTGAFRFKPASAAAGDVTAEAEVAMLTPPDSATDALAAPAMERPNPPANARSQDLEGEAELLFWESIKDSDSAELFEEYLRRFPSGVFVPIALERLAALQREPPAEAEAPITAAVAAEPSSERAGEARREQVALGPAIVAPRPFEPAQLAGRWEGRYQCQGEVVGMALEIEPLQGERVTARFDFFAAAGAPSFPSGSFRADGTFELDGRRLRLQAGDWIERPWGFQRHDLMGVVQDDGRTIEGRVLTTGCSEFQVQRLAGRS
jgi:uncharacterized caspase-like protein